jgi:hypothetical protein
MRRRGRFGVPLFLSSKARRGTIFSIQDQVLAKDRSVEFTEVRFIELRHRTSRELDPGERGVREYAAIWMQWKNHRN